MGVIFWIKRLALSFVFAFVALSAAQWIKGASVGTAASFACLWGAIAAAIFTGVGYIRYKRNPACMIPKNDQPR